MAIFQERAHQKNPEQTKRVKQDVPNNKYKKNQLYHLLAGDAAVV